MPGSFESSWIRRVIEGVYAIAPVASAEPGDLEAAGHLRHFLRDHPLRASQALVHRTTEDVDRRAHARAALGALADLAPARLLGRHAHRDLLGGRLGDAHEHAAGAAVRAECQLLERRDALGILERAHREVVLDP